MSTESGEVPGWKPAPDPENELERLAALLRLEILDTEPEEHFDTLTQLAQRVFRVPTALVSLVDSRRQWFKSRAGLDRCETPRGQSFCAHAIHSDEIFIVEDARLDERFRANPIVAGPPYVTFYAGVPLRSADGYRVGTLCVIDSKPRVFSTEDCGLLRQMGRQVEEHLAARQLRRELRRNLRLHQMRDQLSPNGILFVDEVGTPLHFNERCLDLWGIPREQAESMQGPGAFRQHLYGAVVNPEPALTAIQAFYGSEHSHLALEVTLNDGRVLHCTAAVIKDEGRRIGWAWYFSDLTADRRREAELLRAQQAAEAANVAKSQFLASMSHEMRTPLNAVIGMTELLQGTRLEPDQREFLNTIQTSGENLLALISDILDLSRIEAHATLLEDRPFDFIQVVEDVCSVVATKGTHGRVELGYRLDPALPLGWQGDAQRLSQVLINLLGNALKFTDRGEVTLWVDAVSVKDGTVTAARFQVQDTGIGIAAKDLSKLFKPFSQVDQSSTRRYGGTGLGLSITQRLVRLMGGGEITVASAPGKGSTFSFTLPVRAAAGPLPQPEPLAELAGRRVLIVDDHAINRQTLSMQVQRMGMNAEAVASGVEATALLQRERFDAVLLDYQMPKQDGLAVLKHWRKETILKRLPVVLLSSYGELRDLQEPALQLRARCLAKPVRLEPLRVALAEALGAPEASSGTSASAPPFPAVRGRILLVEDHPMNRLVAEALFAQLGHRIDCAVHGLDALALAAKADYDVVFMDVHMPEMDGLTATRKWRELSGDARRPWIVALTAAALTEEREACLRAGMNDYLAKPVRLADLRRVLERGLAEATRAVATAEGGGEPADTVAPGPQSDVTVEVAGPLAEILAKVWEVAAEDGEDLVRALLQILLEDAPVQLRALQEARAAGDGTGMARAAHSLRGATGNVGAQELWRRSGEIEDAARRGELEDAAAGVAPLVEAWQPLEAQLRAYLGR